jgi:hypothetical protein
MDGAGFVASYRFSLLEHPVYAFTMMPKPAAGLYVQTGLAEASISREFASVHFEALDCIQRRNLRVHC